MEDNIKTQPKPFDYFATDDHFTIHSDSGTAGADVLHAKRNPRESQRNLGDRDTGRIIIKTYTTSDQYGTFRR